MPNQYLEAALSYAERGWHVFPTRITKAPYTTHGVKDATKDPTQIAKWWEQWPNAGIGLACGAVSGVWALDIDTDKGGSLSLEDLESERGTLPDTLWSKTGGGGRHMIFAVPDGVRIRNSVQALGAGLDCRGDGGYIILPPSRHESGNVYEWCADDALVPLLAPDWLLRAVCNNGEIGNIASQGSARSEQALPPDVRHPPSYIKAALATATSTIANAPAGTANNTLNAVAYSFQRFINAGWVRRQVVEDELFAAAEARGKSASEIRKTLASALGASSDPSEPLPPTAVIEQSGQTSSPPSSGAIVEPSSAPMRLAESFLKTQRDTKGRLMLRQWRDAWWRYKDGYYKELEPKDLRADLYKHLDRVYCPDKNRDPKRLDPKIQTVNGVIDAMLGCGTMVSSKIDPPAHLGEDRAFRDVDTAVTSNGMLDIQTGMVAPLSPDLFATSSLGVAWPEGDPPPPPSEWLNFLYDTWGSDDASVKLLQQWFGYCLTPDTSQQKMLWFLGPPRSGKGTIMHILEAILGHENVIHPRLSDLSTPYGLESWENKPLVVVGDARLGGRVDQDTIVETLLSVSGEDRLSVPRKYKTSVTVRLPARIVLQSNLMPRLSDSSGALASRVLLLRTRKSNLGKEDLGLRDRLLAELPGILGWAMGGWRSLRADGRFTQPEASAQSLKDFGSFASPVSAFVEDCCVLKEGAEVSSAALYERWRRWCADNGNEPGSKQNMSRNLVGAFSGVSAHPRGPGRAARFSGIEIDGGD